MASCASTRNLPLENCCWWMAKILNIANDDEGSSDESDDQCMLVITDDKNSLIATDLCQADSASVERHAISLLKDSMLRPMTYKPRRPKFVLFRDMEPLKKNILTDLGISERNEGGYIDGIILLCCSVCRREGSPGLFDTCETCQAVYYCSGKCRENDLNSHQNWCSKMTEYMQNAEPLMKTPFSFSQETSYEHFDDRAYKTFLDRYGILNRGLWIRELDCPRNASLPVFGNLQFHQENPLVLSEGADIVHGVCPEEPPELPLTNWKEYCHWRHIGLDSPIAILLTFPLTVYYVITTLLAQHYPEKRKLLSDGSSVVVHLIGVGKEADYIQLFTEVGCLLPTIRFEFVFVGAEIARKVDGNFTRKGNMTFTTRRGCYHKCNLAKPDVVIGLNAGLGAYPSWRRTLTYLKEQDAVSYFTDYCAYSCECAKKLVEELGIGTISELTTNPFRSPVRKFCKEHRMPWYSNAFVYRLLWGQRSEDPQN